MSDSITRVSEQGVNYAAQELGVEKAVIRAVLSVESNGEGFLPDGRPVVQFEPHVMYRRLLRKHGPAAAKAAARERPDLVSESPGRYGTRSQEHSDMGEAAALFDRQCALESASWGLFQIMGYHWAALGYGSLQNFINAMYLDADAQLDAFVRFVKASPAIHRALKSHDWASFARLYNGPAYSKNKYDVKLEAAYRSGR